MVSSLQGTSGVGTSVKEIVSGSPKTMFKVMDPKVKFDF
jgi:hypothetical protein